MRHLFLLAVLLCAVDRVLPQSGTVAGVAFLPDTSYHGGIVVTILDQNKSAVTQPNGQFTISNVAAGNISVQAGKLYYSNIRVDTTLPASTTLMLSLALTEAIFDTMLNHQTPRLFTSVTNAGNIGALNRFVEPEDPGFLWGGQQQLFEASLMVGIDTTRVSDAARFIFGIAQDNLDQDFLSLSDVVVLTHGSDSTVLLTTYDDSRSNLPPGPPSQPLGVQVTQTSYSFGDSSHNGYLILKVVLKNGTTVTLNNLVVGWFVDWDVGADTANRGGVVFIQNSIPGIGGGQPFETEIAYQRNAPVGSRYMGIIPLSQKKFRASRVASNTREIFVGALRGALTEANKYRYMVSRRDTNIYSDYGVPEDLSMVVSAGGFSSGLYDSSLFTLAPGESVTVGFAFVGGPDSLSLLQYARNAQRKWVQLGNAIDGLTEVPILTEELPKRVYLTQNFPNPFNPSTTVRYHIPSQGKVSIRIYNLLGNEVRTLVSEYTGAGVYEIGWDSMNDSGALLPTGIYIVRLFFESGEGYIFSESRKVLLLR